jgi:hypothetical protein
MHALFSASLSVSGNSLAGIIRTMIREGSIDMVARLKLDFSGLKILTVDTSPL